MTNRFDVDICLRELEEEDERQKEALRKFLERERPFSPDWWKIAAFLGYTLFWFVVVVLLVAGLMAL